MKRIIMLTILIISIAVRANDYTQLTFVSTDGKTSSISSSGLIITFADGYMNATNGSEELSINLSELSKMFFGTGNGSGILLGDVNNDGTVDISDVLATVDYVLGYSLNIFNTENADINCDNVIDISDILSIVDIILGH